MGNRIHSISIRTNLKFDDNKDILFALRNVLDVVETDFGYIVILDAPREAELLQAMNKAITSFKFVEDVSNVTMHEYEPLEFDTDVRERILDAVTKMAPKLEIFGEQIGQFSMQHRAWFSARQKVYEALHGRSSAYP